MKHLSIILIYLISLTGCTKGWDETDKNDFMDDCLMMSGTEEVCLCILPCVEEEYENYNLALINIPKEELGRDIIKCLQECD